jgi:hypothetical protein
MKLHARRRRVGRRIEDSVGEDVKGEESRREE